MLARDKPTLHRIMGWPVENKLLGALGLILFGMSAWTLSEVVGHGTLLSAVVTHQADTDKKLDAVGAEVHEEHQALELAQQAAAALKQRFDDFSLFPKAR